MAERILAGEDGSEVAPGDHVVREVDVLMMHDLGTHGVRERLAEMGVSRLDAPDRIVCPMDHVAPSHTIDDANSKARIRDYVDEMGIEHFYDVGTGIAHQVLYEKGHYTPGDLLVGTDSHTTTAGAFGVAGTGMGYTDAAYVAATGHNWFRVPETVRFEVRGAFEDRVSSKDLLLHVAGEYGTDVGQYRALEYFGGAIEDLPLEDRITLTNMSVELGAKFGFTPVDDTVTDYVDERTDEAYTAPHPDDDAEYRAVHEIHAGDLGPKVVEPHSVGNVVDVEDAVGTDLDQVFLGSCTNGKFADLAAAAAVIDGREVDPRTRFIVTPASRDVYHRAIEAGVAETLTEAGATITNATCGACIGKGMGVLGEDEVCLAAMNRNFQGRMGHDTSEIYLSSPETAAASALAGHIADPREV
jgi:3-isopropylmalate/(R)-2-methylmalate dehydratase large subunit